MMQGRLEVVRWLRVGAPVHAVSLCADASQILVGTDGELVLYTRHGDVAFRYLDPTGELVFRLVRLAPDLSNALAVQRSGSVLRLTIQGRGASQRVEILDLRWNANDIYHLSWHSESGWIALGHYGPALTVLNEHGEIQWRRHPHDGTPTHGKLWSVLLDESGSRLFVGAAGSANNLLASVDASSGLIGPRIQLAARVIHLATLAPPLAVAAILNSQERSVVAAFDSLLSTPVWEYPAKEGEIFTCLESAPSIGVGVVASNAGSVLGLNGTTGALRAPVLSLESTVFALTITPNGRQIGIGLNDGRVGLLTFTAPSGSEETFDL